MTRIHQHLTELIGHTPLLALTRLQQKYQTKANLIAKLEFFNPGGSVKDRVAFAMIEDAEHQGILKQGSTLIEPTSGNTGIGLAMVCAVRGYRIILTMPESMSLERRLLLKAYGAELVLTPASDGMKGAVDKAIQLSKENPDSFIPSQFDNPSNPKAHFLTTAEEIWADLDGTVDIFASGVGTGGTLSGIAKYLKTKNKNIKIVAIEPYNSPVLAGKPASSHALQGIGANFVPANYDAELTDEIIPVKDEDALEMTRLLPKKEGILSGISGAANICAAVELSNREENAGKNIVTIIPDCGDHYLSCGIWN